jgi:uncharacterized membrane protein
VEAWAKFVATQDALPRFPAQGVTVSHRVCVYTVLMGALIFKDKIAIPKALSFIAIVLGAAILRFAAA